MSRWLVAYTYFNPDCDGLNYWEECYEIFVTKDEAIAWINKNNPNDEWHDDSYYYYLTEIKSEYNHLSERVG